MKKLILIVVTMLFAAPLAFAQSPQTADIAVSATVVAQCRIQGGSVAFGNYDPVVANATTDLDGSGTFQVRCTKGTPNVSVQLGQGANAGTGSSDAAPVRQMANGTERLGYQLYRDGGYSSLWGNTTGTGYDYTAANSALATLTIYGRVPQAQDVAVGSYTDTVVASINW